MVKTISSFLVGVISVFAFLVAPQYLYHLGMAVLIGALFIAIYAAPVILSFYGIHYAYYLKTGKKWVNPRKIHG